MPREPIRVIATGGTIDKVYDAQSATLEVGNSAMQRLLGRVALATEIRITSLLQKDSLELTAEDREALCECIRDCPENRIIVTHGTDTMIESARAVQAAGAPGKTVVITGAMVPMAVSRSDADFNLGAALMAASLAVTGVYIAMNGCLFSPEGLTKDRVSGAFRDDAT